MSIKHFISDSITTNPERYAIDGGDLHLINDYFISRRWQPLTREQHVSIANLIRGRITILKDNPLDMRKRFKPKDDLSQTDIYSMIGDATIETYGAKRGAEVEKVLGYFGRDTSRALKPIKSIKNGIRGDISTQSINLSKFVFMVCSKRETKKLFNSLPHRKEKNRGGDKRMKLNENEDINIKQVLMGSGEPRYVEFYSHADSRNHIMNAERFCDVFGYSMKELEEVYHGTLNR